MVNTPRHKKERKVSIVFRRTDEPKHCGGVEALKLLEDGALLTASRDATVRRWNVQGAQPVCQTSYVGHADWVNSLATIDDLLFSCSNDKTVRVWQSTGAQAAVMSYHSDYVTCLAAAKSRPLVASGGLRGELFLIDVTTGQTHRLRPKALPAQPSVSSSLSRIPTHDVQGSAGCTPAVQAGFYSLTTNAPGTVLAGGSSDAIIRIWDTRSGEKICKLRGHTENVRSLLIKDDCSRMLSGSADGTIRLWDLPMQRCLQTYVVHSDSVWCLETSTDWTVVYSGGRDQGIQRTHLASRATELLALESHAVTAIAVNHQDNVLWAATACSSVNQWPLPTEPISSHSKTQASMRRRMLPTVNSGPQAASVTSRQSFMQPVATQPTCTIPGIPAIVVHKVMSDRRHVLTKDDTGAVALWDVLLGSEKKNFGQVEMDVLENELFEARHCPTWFTADNRLGLLCISLEPPQCFNAEEYGLSFGFNNVPDDYKLNYGKMVLECAFAKWKYKATHLIVPSPGSQGSGTMAADRNGSMGPARQAYVEQWLRGQNSGGVVGGPTSPAVTAAAPPHAGRPSDGPGLYGFSATKDDPTGIYFADLWPGYWRGVHPAVTCQSASGAPWYRVISRFTGAEQEPEDIPCWVGDIVLRNAAPTAKESKCAFVLLPAEGSNLPSLLQSKLNAPRILQVHKVVMYCISRLAEADNLQLIAHPVFIKRPPYPLELPVGDGSTQAYELELMCNGVAVPFEMSLSSVKKFIWCKPDDIIFHYRIRDPQNPAPMPNIQPVRS